jgi:ABC-type transport system substrate-binding protein
VRSFDDAEAAYEALGDHDVDWALASPDDVADAIDEHGDEHMTPFHAELFFGLRVVSPVLGNLPLRQAIDAAIDREAIVDAVYDGLADPLSSVVPVGVPGHDPARCPDCGHDPARARQLLAAAFPDGVVPTVAIDFDESDSQQEMAELVAAQLAAVGIPTELRPKPLDQYKLHVVSGAQEMYSFGWIGGYASPDAYLAPLFGSAADDNLAGYASAPVDAALAAARATADPVAALGYWSAVEAQVLADAVIVPIAQFRIRAVLSERLRGVEAAVDGTVDWSAAWVADGA